MLNLATFQTASAQSVAPEFIRKPELARLLGVSPRTIDRWHAKRIGPPRVKIGKQVLYRHESVREWLMAQESAQPRARG